MAKKAQFTENDLKTIRDLLSESWLKMQEDMATSTEKSAVLIPLLKIELMLDALHTKKEAN
jgi:hypothetical protein